MSAFVVAAAQFPVSAPRDFAEFAETLTTWVREAAEADAKLLVFPEYAALILASIFPHDVRQDLDRQVQALQTVRDDYLSLHARLAEEHGVYILAGSFPWQVEATESSKSGKLVNRAWFFSPEGARSFQDKRVMTRFERESWNVSAGEGLRVFDTRLGKIGVTICYDSEFPLLARAQAEAGALLLLTPSCTDTRAGYERVRIGCQARALENQIYVAQAPLVGELPWSPAIDVNVGRAGVFGPPDRGFPDDGVLAQGDLNEPAWVYAAIDPFAVARVRKEGQVRPFTHWPEQDGADLLHGGTSEVAPSRLSERVEVVHLFPLQEND